MRRYQEELGIPFVYVTHNQEEALTMSDRMAVMHRGGLEQVAPKLEVYNAPATRFVASFVGAPKQAHRPRHRQRGRAAEHRLDGHQAGRPRRNRSPAPAIRWRCISRASASRLAPRRTARGTRTGSKARCATSSSRGQFADYFVRTGNEEELVVSAPPTLPGITRGSRVILGWPVEAADVFVVEDGER